MAKQRKMVTTKIVAELELGIGKRKTVMLLAQLPDGSYVGVDAASAEAHNYLIHSPFNSEELLSLGGLSLKPQLGSEPVSRLADHYRCKLCHKYRGWSFEPDTLQGALCITCFEAKYPGAAKLCCQTHGCVRVCHGVVPHEGNPMQNDFFCDKCHRDHGHGEEALQSWRVGLSPLEIAELLKSSPYKPT